MRVLSVETKKNIEAARKSKYSEFYEALKQSMFVISLRKSEPTIFNWQIDININITYL